MKKRIILALIILILGSGVAFFVFKTEPGLNKNFETQSSFFKKFPFRLGLDLSGGSHLIYRADVSAVSSGEVSSSMNALRDVIERRINLFGVSEPVVQVQHSGFISGAEEQLIVDLPGITDVKQA
ncbi:MAG: Preprotein translocase subunit SecD, partial [Candidatus Daviesbacteria bacterium GW2011_GWA2_39_33]